MLFQTFSKRNTFENNIESKQTMIIISASSNFVYINTRSFLLNTTFCLNENGKGTSGFDTWVVVVGALENYCCFVARFTHSYGMASLCKWLEFCVNL